MQHLNHIYKNYPAFYELDDSYEGFEWIDFHDSDNSVVAFMRKSRDGQILIFVMNGTPVVRGGYRLGVPESGFYKEILNTDSEVYGGGNVGNMGGVSSEPIAWQGRDHSVQIELPPLAVVGFAWEAD